MGGIDQAEMFVKGERNQQIAVKVVGAKRLALKQSKLENLEEAGLREMQISRGDENGLIEKRTPNLRIVNLSKNLLPSWQEVSRITQQLKLLHQLNLSENRLQLPSNPDALRPAFPALTKLFLNYSNLTWQQIEYCEPMWPNLRELHVCYNTIASIPRNDLVFHSLELLNLEGNKVSSWKDIKHLGYLPSLKRMILNDMGLEEIEFNETALDHKTSLFPCLSYLSLNNNLLSKWSSINELEKLSELTELKLKRNPLCADHNQNTVRELLIAKLSSLETCNLTHINAVERKGSEVDYLKMFGREWMEAGGHQDATRNKPSSEFTLAHPRYQQLINLYGPAEESEWKEHSSALKHSLIKLTIQCPQKPDKKTVTKKLPETMTVQKLKTLVYRLFKVNIAEQKLSYTSHKVKDGPEINIDNDQRDLSFFSLENGDIIWVKW